MGSERRAKTNLSMMKIQEQLTLNLRVDFFVRMKDLRKIFESCHAGTGGAKVDTQLLSDWSDMIENTYTRKLNGQHSSESRVPISSTGIVVL